MAFLIGGANSAADTAYDVANSCRIETGTDVGVYYTPSENGAGAGKKFTFSCWVKRSVLGANSIMVGAGTDSGDDDDTCFRFTSADLLQLTNFAGSSATLYSTTTTAKFRDVAAWYHCVASVDTADGTEANRVKLYVNGEYISGVTGDYPTQNFVYKWCMQHMQVVGARPNNDNPPNTTSMIQCTGGYLAEVMMVDNQQLAASSFGETDEDSGIWKPKNISGIDVGTNGFYLEFKQTGTGTAGTTTIGADTSGETNHLTSLNLAATDITTDTPTNNFAIMNPMQSVNAANFSEGSLKINLATNDDTAFSSIAPSEGKWYWEEKRTTQGGRGYTGICDFALPEMGGNAGRDASNEWAIMIDHNGNTEEGGANTTVNSHVKGSAPSDGDIFTYAVDLDNGQVWVGVNANVDITGTANVTGFVTGIPYFYFFEDSGSGTTTIEINFGNPSFSISSGNADADGYGNFEYEVPSGYYALCTKNLAEYG